MSFLFKSSKKGSAIPNGLPPATRDIKSSDGPQSQIPTLNGMMNGSKPGSPTPHQQGSVNNSLNSVGGDGRSNSAPPQEELARKQLMRTQQEGMTGPPRGPPSPEQKMLRESSREPVCFKIDGCVICRMLIILCDSHSNIAVRSSLHSAHRRSILPHIRGRNEDSTSPSLTLTHSHDMEQR